MPVDFDRLRHELNTPAGVVDLRTAVVRAHTNDDLFRHCTNCAPDLAAAPYYFLRFLESIFRRDTPEQTEATVCYVQNPLGYCLTGEINEQVFAFFFGSGCNGKSALLDLVLSIMGDYAIKLPAEVLMLSRCERHPTEIAQLNGVRLAVSNEIA